MRRPWLWAGAGILSGLAVLAGILLRLPDLITLQGILVHRNVLAVSGPFEGKILAVFVKAGQRVGLGEPLFLLDSQELERELLSLTRQQELVETGLASQTRALALKDRAAEAEVRLLEAQLEGFRSTPGMLSGREGEKRETEWNLGRLRRRISAEILEGELRELKYRLEVLAQGIQAVEKKIRSRVVCSPAEGVFLDRQGYSAQAVPREPVTGQWCSLGQTLGYIGVQGALDLQAEMGMEYFLRIESLQRVTIRLPAGLNQGREIMVEEKVLKAAPGSKPGVFSLTVSWTQEDRCIPPGAVLEVKVPLLPLRTFL